MDQFKSFCIISSQDEMGVFINSAIIVRRSNLVNSNWESAIGMAGLPDETVLSYYKRE